MENKQKPTIIFIHGTMGSALRKNGVKLWPAYLGKKTDYKKILTPVTENDGIEPYRLFNTYLPLKRHLLCLDYKVVDFLYDWRKNNLDHLLLLKQKIEEIDSEEVIIMAHSMGGILAKLCLNKYKNEPFINKVIKLITIGTPWKGSMDAIKILKYGSKVPEKPGIVTFINKEETKLISTFFPSVYQLLPNQSYIDYLKKSTTLPYSFNGTYYYDTELFFKEVLHAEFTHDYSATFNEFFELLSQTLPTSIEHHEIIGCGIPTISVISEKSNKEPYALWDDGDGTVPLLSSFSNIDNNIQSDKYFSYLVYKKGHNFLPSYPEVYTLIEQIIKDNKQLAETPTISFNTHSDNYKKFNGYIQKVACPVEVSISDNEGKVIYGHIDAMSEEEIKDIANTEHNVTILGSTTYIVYDQEDDTSIENYNELIIDAYDEGPTSISIDKFENGNIIKREAFDTFNITPKKQARVKLKSDVTSSSLTIYEDDESIETRELKKIEFDESKITLPITTLEINGEFVVNYEEDENNNKIYLVKKEATLTVQAIQQGSFNVHETHITINNTKMVLNKEDSINLDKSLLKPGFNEIQFYTVDVFDNTEKIKSIYIYFVETAYEKIQFYFTDKHYIIKIQKDAFYDKMLREFKLSEIPPTLNFDLEEGVVGYDVVYQNVKRNLEIELQDVFGDSKQENIIVDEVKIKEIIRGSATIDKLLTVVKEFNITNPSYKFGMKDTGNKGRYTTPKQESLDACTSVEISDDLFDIKFVKTLKYDVRFSVITEKINIAKQHTYRFMFTVRDYSSNLYVDNFNLEAILEFKVNDKLYQETFVISYIVDLETYAFTIDLENVKKYLSGFWKNGKNQLIDGEITIKNKANNIAIRHLLITIENE